MQQETDRALKVMRQSHRMIWIDSELTGLDVERDEVMEIAVVVTESNPHFWPLHGIRGMEVETMSIVIHLDDNTLESMSRWFKSQHGKSGLIEESRNSNISCEMAEEELLDMLRRHTVEGMSTLAGDKVGRTRMFIDRKMPRLAKWLSRKTKDVFDIGVAVKEFKPNIYKNRPMKSFGHRALTDINECIAEYTFYYDNQIKCPADAPRNWECEEGFSSDDTSCGGYYDVGF